MSGYGSADDHLDVIESVVLNEIDVVRSMLPTGESNEYCDDCGEEIPHARREAMPGCKFCIACQPKYDANRPRIRALDWIL